jgi:serine/threonine-protein kinase
MLRAQERIGDWIIEAPLGEGGMGAVYRVHSALTQRLVAALKVMKPTAEPDARARFVREAEALSALRHPAVVRVMGFSEDAPRGLLYLVMELAVGETLRARVQRGAMPLPEALATFVPLAQGLDHAHSAGIFHRDLKPSNVILCEDGTPRLVDFGIAAALHTEPLTTTGQLGTLPYLPPEVFRGERADPAAIDVYAFGLLLHEALTGQRSFPVGAASTPAAAAAAIGVRKLQAPTVELPEGFPPRLRELVRRATAADPAARPTMRALREELESAVERRTGAVAPGRLAPVPSAVTVTDEATTRVPDPTSGPIAESVSGGALGVTTGGSRLGRRRGDRTRAWMLTAAAIAAVALAVALALAQRPSGPEAVAVGASRPSLAPVTLAPARPRAASPVAPATAKPERDPSPPAATPDAPRAEDANPDGDHGGGISAAARPPGPASSTTGARPPPAVPTEPPAEAVEAPDEERAAEQEAGQVSGRWALMHDVENSRDGSQAGGRIGYRLTLFQEGDRVYGQGRRVSENGVMLPPAERASIDVAGRIQAGQVILDFTEIGKERTSRGTIRWQLDPGRAALQGRFTSDAGDSGGLSSGRRLP